MRTSKFKTGQVFSLALLAAISLSSILSPSVQAKSAHPAQAVAAVAPAPAQSEAITWVDDLRTGLKMAQSSRRWVLVDCFTDWCHWCKRLDADVLQNPTVDRQLGSHFVWVKCNTQNPQTGEWVRDKYGVDVYPCILILDPAGNEKGRIRGYCAPAVFVNKVARIVSH